MLRAVLFDMDGVIVDTEPLHRKAYYKMFNEMNIDVSEALFSSFTGQATLQICERLCTTFNLSQSPKELMHLKRHHFNYLFENDKDLTLIDGVLDLIKEYHQNGLQLVVASSASMPNINRIFERFDLNKYFKAKLSGADLKASKPHPEIFIKAAQAASVEKNECIVIEDSTNGMKAANKAGIYCVGYQSEHSVNQDYNWADLVIGDYKEIDFTKACALLN